jgi:hypothetical protein
MEDRVNQIWYQMNMKEISSEEARLQILDLLTPTPEYQALKELTRWIPVGAKEILQVANDEKQKDWNDLKYRDVYRDGFIEGAHWMQARIQRITPPEGV